ncbi:hypothetical protein [Novosphingobium sp. JCM 18896]|uniref:hypothetical protein n=1 Tax=Novosphingobium sp. JCM 18896 TaxID=2989731 RepID=UPI002221BD26|nr:hypothetical protein [Novosphingobium sp. JCM 18896]MCW1428291.1 hypothetical protein [Novosphingobium sp. JCM 18896]
MTESNVVKLPEAKAKAEDAGKAVVDFARDHPGLVVAGGVALGLVAGALLSRGSGRKLARHALTLAEMAGTASMAFGRQALERAEDAGEGLRRQGEVLVDKAGKLRGPAEDAVDNASEAAQRLLHKAVELAGKLRR